MKVLGIETSCDETAAAVVTDDREILSNVLHSQIKEHSPYGGVVPEIASRSHTAHIEPIVKQAMEEANISFDELDAIAVTGGPGLIGGVIVGVMAAKGIAVATDKPLICLNHLEGHALTARLTDDVQFPFLLLLVSGGHCQILVAEAVGKYKILGGTIDDSIGEAFDKTAKMMRLGYPGGPIVEKRAKEGDPNAYKLPRPLLDRPGCDFSFSGLKTAIYRAVDGDGKNLSDQEKNNLCASFQTAAGDVLEDRMKHAIEKFKEMLPNGKTIVVAGGVAANQYLIGRLKKLAEDNDMECVAPPIRLCTDNAAMIAWAGIEKFKLGHTSELDFEPKARWAIYS